MQTGERLLDGSRTFDLTIATAASARGLQGVAIVLLGDQLVGEERLLARIACRTASTAWIFERSRVATAWS